ncbi:MAG: hypothetical protein BGO70_08920 [Bacteroidetes bacterium 43-93]|nr:hypothetical protein [Bacteroidota bacterium]OJX00287.1 MAG: hypothetical protein BGO70_08920 [Bacteroidetes bacterium 43-93]
MGQHILSFLKYCILTFLFTYGIFYTSYKYGRPDLGNWDFLKYSKMVDAPLNLSATVAPHALRQLPTLLAYAAKQSRLYYPNDISFARSVTYKGLNMQKNFFALLLVNYAAFIAAVALIIWFVVTYGHLQKSNFIYFSCIALCSGYFMVPVNIIAPMSQGFGWLASVLLSIGIFSARYRYIIIGGLIGIFSRETTVLFFMVLSIISGVVLYMTKRKPSFFFNTSFILLGLFVTLLLFRINLTTGQEKQFSILYLIGKTFDSATKADYLFQAFLTQGLLFFLFTLCYKKDKRRTINYIAAAIFILLIGGFGAGRLLGETYPYLVLLYLLPSAADQKPGGQFADRHTAKAAVLQG